MLTPAQSTSRHLLPPGAKEQLSPPSDNPENSKLVQSIEQFLLSFTYPPSTSSSSSLILPSISLPPPSHPNQNGTTTRTVLPSSPLSGVDGKLTSQRRNSTAPANWSCWHASAGPATVSSAATAVPYILPAGVLGAWPSSGANDPVTGSDVRLTVGELIVMGALDGVATGAPGVLGDAGDGVRGVGMGGDQPGSAAWPRAWISRGKDVEVVCSGVGHDVGYGNGSAKHRGFEEGSGKLMTGVMIGPVGLPTPLDSEPSLDGGSATSHVRSSEDDVNVVETMAVSVVHESYARVVGVGEARKLRARMAGVFGGRMLDREKAREGQMGAITRLRRVWGVSRALS